MSTFDYDFAKPFAELEPPHWGALRELCRANAEYFSNDSTEAGICLNKALLAMLDNLEQVRPLYREISKIAPLFDFDSQTPGNGYRSFLSIVDKCILHSVCICRQLCCHRDSILFRKTYYMRYCYILIDYSFVKFHFFIFNFIIFFVFYQRGRGLSTTIGLAMYLPTTFKNSLLLERDYGQ